MRLRRRGAAAMEFALSFPVFMLAVGGMIDFGWMFMQKSALDSAAHLGCRQGTTVDPGRNNADMARVITTAEDAMREELAEAGGDCNNCDIEVRDVYDYPARSLNCTIESDYRPLFGFAPRTRLHSEAVVRMEFQR